MRFTRVLLVTALLTALLPTAAQQPEAQPYFGLSSYRTFGPGDKPTIQLWANGLDLLEFRVYRVIDPVKFFQKLEDVHGFTGTPPRKARQLTLLERFHQWKVGMRNRVRNTFRAQYSDTSRGAIRNWISERNRTPVYRATNYAEMPLLNSQQVVTVWKQSIAQSERWKSEAIPVDVHDKGLYLVEAAHGDLRAYTIIIVTDLTVLTKTAPGRVLTFVTDRAAKAPLADCELLLWSDKEQIARQTTDASGLAEFKFEQAKPESALLLARRGPDFAVTSLSTWNLSNDPDRYTVGYLYTDRPIYRPGHTVHWKGILRSQTGSAYQLLSRKQVPVEVTDTEGKTVWRGDVNVSPLGTIQGDFTLPESASLGYYSIDVHIGEADVNAGFQVEEYKKPEYEVRVMPEQRRLLQGTPIKAVISARYFFGEPVVRAKAKYVVHRSRYWFPLYAVDEEQMRDDDTEGDYVGEADQVVEEERQLDADGKLAITVPTEESDRHWDMRYRIEARVTDAGNREIAGYAFVVATHGSFVMNVEPDQYVYEPGATARLSVEARDYDGKPIQTAVHAELRQYTHWDQPDGPIVQQADGKTGAGGAANFDMPVGKSGSYIARVTARSEEGRLVEAQTYLWVAGGSIWSGGGRERLQIVPDKKSYKPGDVAKILVVTGVPEAHVLVTTEGRELYTRQVVKATKPAFTVQIPVKPEYSPNFYLSAVLIQDTKMLSGVKSIPVPATQQQLNVEVQPSKPEFKPGEPAVYTVTARDGSGKPVAGEFSLGLVDEAIYTIRPDTTQEIFKFFYGRVYNRVGTESSLSYFFQSEAGKRRMMLTQFRNRRNLAQIKPEALVQPKVRKAFPDTALWLANLMTDASGRAQARFNFPDALTTWRATARGVTLDTKVGSTIQKTIVRKNLIVRLSTPRFFTHGDEVTLSVLVHNYLKNDKTARVSLDAQGVDLVDGSARDVAIPSGGEAKVDWRVRAKAAVREVKLLAKALTDEESDAMELTLPSVPFGVKLAVAKAGTIAASPAETEVDLTVPQSAVPSSRVMEISVTPSVAGTIFGALEYLTSFPYGCTEQTMSSFLPNVIVSQALKDLKLKSRIDPASLQKKVMAGMDRLYDYQHDDGGWGWWKTDQTHPFMTAYVVAGLAQARAAGYTVKPEAIDRGVSWLRTALSEGKNGSPDLRAYAVYALALSGLKDKAVFDAAWDQRDKMTAYGNALLGLGLGAASDRRATEMAAALEQKAKSDEREASWPVDTDYLLDFHGDTTPEATAHAVKLLARLRPESPVLPKAVLWLVNHRNEGYYWESTKQTAMVVYGLTDYLKMSGELKPNLSATVTVNGKQVSSPKFTESDAMTTNALVIKLSGDDVRGDNKIRITKSGEGRLYWSARADYYTTEERLSRTGPSSLRLSREYFKLTPVKEGDKIVHTLDPLAGAAAPGDVLVVRLTLEGGEGRYLLIEDPIPAGAEFVEKDDLYEIKNKPPWWKYSFSRREFHDDHAAIFQNYFFEKPTEHLYLLKVVNPGLFRIGPARVQPMYQPQYISTTESRTLEVK